MKRSGSRTILFGVAALLTAATLALVSCRKSDASGGTGIGGRVAAELGKGLREGSRVVQGLQGPAAGGLTAGWRSAEDEETVPGTQTILSVSNVSGPIRVTGSDGDALHLRYVKQARTDADLQAFLIEVRAEGDAVEVKPVYGVASMGRFGSVELELSVPARFRSVTLANVSGDTTVGGLEGPVDLALTSVSGATSFDLSGGTLRVASTSGSIEGTVRSLDAGGAELKSVSGKIELRVPAALEAKLDLHSISGSVTCELPVTASEKSRTKLRGTVGSGSVPLSISTTSGSIAVRSE
jgi:DUF4097 and DUF4098 domain-containing protein YvlB